MEEELLPQEVPPLPPPSQMLLMKLRGKCGAGLVLNLLIVRGVTRQGGYKACNEEPCLYFVGRSRPDQPSSWGQFATVQNGISFDYKNDTNGLSGMANYTDRVLLDWRNRTTPEVHHICSSDEMISSIENDLTGEKSLWCLLACLVFQALTDYRHDFCLLHERKEATVSWLAMCSYTLSCGTAVLAMMWGMTLSETFVARDTDSDILCFYALPTVGMLLALASVCKLCVQPFLRMENLFRALHYGDYLYYFHTYTLPYNFIRTNIASETVGDASSSLLVPQWAGPMAATKLKDIGAERDTSWRHRIVPPPVCLFRIKSGFGDFTHFQKGSAAFQTLACVILLSHNLQFGEYALITVCSQLAVFGLNVATFGNTPDLVSYFFLSYYGTLLPKQIVAKATSLSGVSVSESMGPPAQVTLCLMSSVSSSLICFMATPVVGRTAFLILQHATWLGPSTPTPERASFLAHVGTHLLQTGLWILQVFTLLSFQKYKRMLLVGKEDATSALPLATDATDGTKSKRRLRKAAMAAVATGAVKKGSVR